MQSVPANGSCKINSLIARHIFSSTVRHVANTEVDGGLTIDPDVQEMWPVLGTTDGQNGVRGLSQRVYRSTVRRWVRTWSLAMRRMK